MRWTVGAVLLVVALPALSSNWVEVSKDGTGNKVAIDMESLTADRPGITKVWVRFSYAAPQKLPESSDKFYAEQKNLALVNCAKREYALSQIVYYDKDGKAMTGNSGLAESFSEPIPDSFGDIVMKKVCVPAGAAPKR